MHWKKGEIEYLVREYPTGRAIEELSLALNKSIRATRHKAARLALSRPNAPSNKPKDPNHRNKADKRYYLRNREKIYQNKKKRMTRYKLEMINLLGGKCSQCGYKDCSAALEFHHKTGKKDENITRLLGHKSKQQILKEVKRCILLCANCHRALHYRDHSSMVRIDRSSIFM